MKGIDSMKSIVIYNSMSGNTKKIAEAIHTGMSRSGEQCDIAKILSKKTVGILPELRDKIPSAR
jgi:menaquinone-dependent protoporphyrinogen IX oxidase